MEQKPTLADAVVADLIVSFSIPIILFVIGIFTMPFGVILWVIALIVFFANLPNLIRTLHGKTTATKDQEN